MDKIENIISFFNNLNSDIRAEALIALLVEQGIPMNDIRIYFDGLFKRDYGRDINSIQTDRNINEKKLLAFHLSREGIYDMLPEGFFHKSTRDNFIDVDSLIKKTRVLRKEEENARKLFRPLENEFFYQRLEQERIEKQTIQELINDLYHPLLLKLWEIDETIPYTLFARIVILLPYAYKITGDLDLTIECLRDIIQEKVAFKVSYEDKVKINNEELIDKEGYSLGRDFICGDEFFEFSPRVKLVIGPVSKEKIFNYTQDGYFFKFIQLFCSFFVPFIYEIDIKILVSDDDCYLALDEDKYSSILGYSASL